MKTLIEAILNKHEINVKDAKCSVRDAVLAEASDAKAELRMGKFGIYIKSGRKTLGKGIDEDQAWENAILNILDI